MRHGFGSFRRRELLKFISARSRLLGSLVLVAVASVIPVLTSSGAAAAAGSAHGRVSIFTILRAGDGVSGVRGTTNGNVVLTGGTAGGEGLKEAPFLFRGRLSRAAEGAAVSVLRPPFRGVTTATFYGPDTHSFNPKTIPAGRVRAVGSYQSSSSSPGVRNRGMIYLGPVSGRGGSWTSIDVPAHGQHTAGHVRACPRNRPERFVMDTIPHNTMGNLVVGNYDLNPGVPGGVVSGNAFIYNMTRHQWTLLRLGGSLSSKSTLYGIWQNGGPASPVYTLAGGSSAHGSSPRGNQRGFLMNYNERTGIFGKPAYYSYANDPAAVTHFEGITAVRGGFNLVAGSSAEAASLAFVPVRGRHRSFDRARWFPINVAASPLCRGGCSVVSGDTVYKNRAMGLYIRAGSATAHTYLAIVS
ncbi:MAG: hypothetical protein ACTHQQ_11585 [Solirubrobacteraceae bacterium]